jgi:hypothetical protein
VKKRTALGLSVLGGAALRFRQLQRRYMHCDNLKHEDHAMMGAFF